MRHPALILGTLCAALLAGCGASSAPASKFPRPEERVERTSLVIAHGDGTWRMDPIAIDAASLQRSAHVYEALVGVDADLNIVPQLARSWGTIDERTWEFRLRPGVQFQSGRDLTPNDVIASFKHLEENGSEDVKALFSTIDRIIPEQTDGLRIKTYEPDPLLLRRLRFLRIGDLESTTTPLPGTGPYRVVRMTDEALELERFDEYWGPKTGPDLVTIRSVGSASERAELLRSGAVQVLGDVPPEIAAGGESITVRSRASLRSTYLVLHPREGERFLGDPSARRAVDAALDRSALTTFAEGYITPQHQLLPVTVFGANPKAEERVRNIEEAKKLLSTVTAADPAFTLGADPSLEKLADLIAVQLRDAGIRATVTSMDGAAQANGLASGDFDAMLVGWSFDIGDPQDFLMTFFHSQDAKRGQLNSFEMASDESDAAIEVAGTKLKPQERVKLVRLVTEAVESADIFLPLFTARSVVAFGPTVRMEARADGLVLAGEVTLVGK